MKTFEYSSLGNDLFAKFYCDCPSELFKGTPVEHIMKTNITLSGYNDDYFFDVDNKEPREYKCKCGKRYSYQWKRNGVEVEEIN